MWQLLVEQKYDILIDELNVKFSCTDIIFKWTLPTNRIGSRQVVIAFRAGCANLMTEKALV